MESNEIVKLNQEMYLETGSRAEGAIKEQSGASKFLEGC